MNRNGRTSDPGLAGNDSVADIYKPNSPSQNANKPVDKVLNKNKRHPLAQLCGVDGICTTWRSPTSDVLPFISGYNVEKSNNTPYLQKFFKNLFSNTSAKKVETHYSAQNNSIATLEEDEDDPNEKLKTLISNRDKGVRLYQRSRTIFCKKPVNIQRKIGDINDITLKKNLQESEYTSPKFRAQLTRRYSHDDHFALNREYLIDVKYTLKHLLSQEDTDGDYRITVLDKGPKSFLLGSLRSNGYKKYEIRGTYNISNLLQELALASELNYNAVVLSQERLDENPLHRLDRVIRDVFWDNLTRCLDYNSIGAITKDTKFADSVVPTIYVPYDDNKAIEYYTNITNSVEDYHIDVIRLPKIITPEYVRDINYRPGILCLRIKCFTDPETGKTEYKPCKYVVPGGRFNEMYGWDSYFIVLGLLQDGLLDLAIDIVDNISYEIEYYGMILNANRSYYLNRSQPPLFTDMINKIAAFLISDNYDMKTTLSIIYKGYRAVIKELFGIWLSKPRYIPSVGLSRYCSLGIGVPPETEPSHFHHLLKPYAKKFGVSFDEFIKKYNYGELVDENLNEYFLHDRAVRESGHDTTYRFDGRCANLNTIDLNCLIYKYETDIAKFVKNDPRGYIIMNIRRGNDDVFLNSFRKFASDLATKSFDSFMSDEEGMELNWTNGIFIDDDELDEANIDFFSADNGISESECNGLNDCDVLRRQCNVSNNKIYSCQNNSNPYRSENNDITSHHVFECNFPIGSKLLDSTSESNIDSDIIAPMWAIKKDTENMINVFEVRFYPSLFDKLSEFTRKKANQYLWNEEKCLFFDYDFKNEKQSEYETVTTLWSLWSGLATVSQAEKMVPIALNKFEVTGGLTPGTGCSSYEALKLDKPSRQWDYPYGWAPHQVLAWMGLEDYGYYNDSIRLAYKWVYLISKSFFDFNGVVPEKFDIVNMTHIFNVEYGNVGSDFTYVVKEGFGWMNASFKFGLTYLPSYMRLRLGVLTHPDEYFYNKQIRIAPMCSIIPT